TRRWISAGAQSILRLTSRPDLLCKDQCMNVNGQTITVTLQVPRDVYDRASQTASQERRPLEDLLSRLLAEGLNVHGTLREVFEQVSAQHRARLRHEGKLSQ